MAAFINALAEEGTNAEIMDWIIKGREATGTLHPPMIAYMEYDRQQLIAELVRLWEIECKQARRFDVC